jgi:uncharacterized protein YndB with AHSA1/START domain
MNKAKVTAPEGVPYVVIERDFDAPKDKVFTAMTRPELVAKWWVGPGYKVRVDKLEARDGGAWKFVQTDEKGQEWSFHGSYHTVSPDMIIQTFEFDGLPEPGHVALEKMTLTEKDGRTRMRVNATYMTQEDRDGMMASGMEGGMQNTYDQLDKVLADMAAMA